MPVAQSTIYPTGILDESIPTGILDLNYRMPVLTGIILINANRNT
jgi:hypothetical protein